MFLSERVEGRDNNLNLVRFVAAVAVLISHSYPLSAGPHVLDPLGQTTGMTIGSLAVDVFFVTSGFLVTGSLFSRSNALDFLVSRILRIYPALLAMVAATVVAGALFTTLPLKTYFTSPDTLGYVLMNSTMIAGARMQLPSMFSSNPYPSAVNGSLWTLPWELRMYAALASIWLASRLGGRRRRAVCEISIVALAFVAVVLLTVPKAAPGLLPPFATFNNRLVPEFFIGAALYVLRAHIRLSPIGFLICSVGWASAAAALEAEQFVVASVVLLPYAVLYLAYVPGRVVRKFNKVGDFSYGIYIYAFPVQQTVAHLFPGISEPGLVWIPFPITLVLAWCSWHFLEEPALEAKPTAIALAQRVFRQKAKPLCAPNGAPN